MHDHRVLAVIIDAEHAHRRQAHQQLAHARRVGLHRGSPDRLASEPPDSQSPVPRPVDPQRALTPRSDPKRRSTISLDHTRVAPSQPPEPDADGAPPEARHEDGGNGRSNGNARPAVRRRVAALSPARPAVAAVVASGRRCRGRRRILIRPPAAGKAAGMPSPDVRRPPEPRSPRVPDQDTFTLSSDGRWGPPPRPDRGHRPAGRHRPGAARPRCLAAPPEPTAP
jgi:hypothetical protein